MSDIAVFVPTYDGYADIWPIQAALWQRFWPEREWPVYWMSSGQSVPDIAMPLIAPALPRTEWGYAVEIALNQIREPLILWWFDEIFPLSKIPNDLFLEAAKIMRTNNDIGIVQLTRYYYSSPNPTIGNFGDIPHETAGFCSAMPAIFRKEIALHLVKELRQSNWFEQQSAAVMLRDFPKVRSLASSKPMFKLCDNALLAGPWRSCAVKHLTELGIKVDFSIRGIAPGASDYMDGVTA